MTEHQPHQMPETRVLAIASHVVSGYVGNKIAVFTLQSLGCDVAALNTVQFSNHTGYKQWKGSRVAADEITELWEGLKQSYLDDFDMMLSGYIPGAAAVEAVGKMAEELQEKAKSKPGSFFWVLDPVMGDDGDLYVAPDVVPAYKRLLGHADLILPNQFEAELLSDVKIIDMTSLGQAIQVLHERYGIPHVVITSVSLDQQASEPVSRLSVIGSTMTSDRKARAFKITCPRIDAYFSGTGDMFAALMVVRMREVVSGSGSGSVSLQTRPSWVSDDAVPALDLPLARACEKVLASMHEVLDRTSDAMKAELAKARTKVEEDHGTEEERKEKMHLLKSKAAELRLVRHLDCLRSPQVRFTAQDM